MSEQMPNPLIHTTNHSLYAIIDSKSVSFCRQLPVILPAAAEQTTLYIYLQGL